MSLYREAASRETTVTDVYDGIDGRATGNEVTRREKLVRKVIETGDLLYSIADKISLRKIKAQHMTCEMIDHSNVTEGKFVDR